MLPNTEFLLSRDKMLHDTMMNRAQEAPEAEPRKPAVAAVAAVGEFHWICR